MISDFEQSLANALGARLSPPFQGRVQVAPGTGDNTQPRILLGVSQATPLEPDFSSNRNEVVPGVNDARRVLRLQCQVRLEVLAATNQGRAQQLQGLQAAMFELDSPDFRSGKAITNGTDPGFLVERLKIGTSVAPLQPATGEQAVSLTVSVSGLFWVIGTPGETGIEIGEIRLRGVVLPLALLPLPPVFAAGAGAFNFSLRVQTTSPLRLSNQNPAPPALPLAPLVVRLIGEGGTPGAGSLGGGVAGAEPAVRLLTLTNDVATFTYTPPAQAARDELVVSLEDGENQAGIEIGRFELRTR